MVQGRLFESPITLSQLASHLWEAANILRGSPVDRTDWKSYILPLLFLKRVCDVWDEEYESAQSLEDGFMGRVCLVRQADKSLLNQRIGRFLFTSKKLEPEFAFRVLQTSEFQQYSISMCEGTKVKHIFWSHLERFTFQLPKLECQRQIIAKLNQIDESVAVLSRKVKEQRQLHFRLTDELMKCNIEKHG